MIEIFRPDFRSGVQENKNNDEIVELFKSDGMKLLEQKGKEYVQIGDVYMGTDEIPEEFQGEVEAMIKAYRDHLDGKIKKLAE
jgi:hypothetical protein